MSLGALHWSIVPVEPAVIGAADDNLEWLLLQALNLGDPFEQTSKDSLASSPQVIIWGTPAATFLRGALAGLPDRVRGDSYAHGLAQFLAELEEHGSLQIGCSR